MSHESRESVGAFTFGLAFFFIGLIGPQQAAAGLDTDSTEGQIYALRTQLSNDNLPNTAAGQYDYRLGAFYIDCANGRDAHDDHILNVV